MSLILDALNKSDRDANQTGTVPTIHHHVTPPDNDNKRLQPMTFWLAGGLIFTLALRAAGATFATPCFAGRNFCDFSPTNSRGSIGAHEHLKAC